MRKRLLYYLAGFVPAALTGILIALAMGKSNHALWVFVMGNASGSLVIAWAQHRGIIPAPEDYYKPIALFPREAQRPSTEDAGSTSRGAA